MSKQKTAVEWLVNELIKYGCIDLPSSPIDGSNRAIHKAKQLERQQIIDAFDEGNPNGFLLKDGEQYYNETYNQ